MKIDSSWVLSIARVQNGYIVSSRDEDDEGVPYISTDVVEEIDDELKAMQTLLYLIKEYFGVYYNKHDKRNLTIEIEEGIKDEIA